MFSPMSKTTFTALSTAALALTIVAGASGSGEAASLSRADTLVQTPTFPSGDDWKTVARPHTGGKGRMLVQSTTFPRAGKPAKKTMRK